MGYEIYESESGELAAGLIQRAVLRERCYRAPLILHSDNGAPMKSQTLQAKLLELQISSSYSRPRVSDDNAYVESLFKTLKYCPSWPSNGFKSLSQAREWVDQFTHWYNTEHRHSAIGFVTPEQRHLGKDIPLLEARKQLWEEARCKNPERWSHKTRCWKRREIVTLNPDKEEKITSKKVA